MTMETQHKELLTQFIDEVWNTGDAETADRYIAPAYTIHHDPGAPRWKWRGFTYKRNNRTFLYTESVQLLGAMAMLLPILTFALVRHAA